MVHLLQPMNQDRCIILKTHQWFSPISLDLPSVCFLFQHPTQGTTLYVINHPCLFRLVLAVTVSQIFFLLDSFEKYLARYFVACCSFGLGLMASSWLDWGDGLYRSDNRGNLHFISLLFIFLSLLPLMLWI